MKFSKLALSAALAVAASGFLVAPGAMASDGTITFTGKIMGQTCQVTNGDVNGDINVKLPLVQTGDFSSGGDTAGSTDFEIDLSNCPTAASIDVAASFSAGQINTAGRLDNTGTATGVDVALYNQGSATALDLGTNGGVTSASWVAITGTPGGANLKYTAKYYAVNGTVGAGTVSSSVEYTLIYQ